MTPASSPFAPPTSHRMPSTSKKAGKQIDPVLHRVLDKTYRIQATPLASARKPYGHPTYGISTPKFKPKSDYLDSSPLSSPEIEVPKLHSEIFSSPIKEEDEESRPRQRRLSKPSRAPKPGISVLTPAKHNAPRPKKSGGWDSEEDFDDGDEDEVTALFGDSPPKTMQFHVPQSRLLKTPGMFSDDTHREICRRTTPTKSTKRRKLISKQLQPRKPPNASFPNSFIPPVAVKISRTSMKIVLASYVGQQGWKMRASE